MVKLNRIGRFSENEKTLAAIIQTLEKHPQGLGARELIRNSGIKSNETFYKYLPELVKNKIVEFKELNVGRGKPKKIYSLSKKGLAYSIEFKIMEYFERIRKECKEKDQVEIDNYTFSYAIYGMPKNLTQQEKEHAETILKRVNSALLDLDYLRHQAIDKEANNYRKAIINVHANCIQYVADQYADKKPIMLGPELLKELDSYIPALVKEKVKLEKNDDFALIITRGPSFIEEYSLRPENYLLELLQSVEKWDTEGIETVIGQLAKNKYFDQEAIDRIKKWEYPAEKISDYYWQEFQRQLDDIPKIREEQHKAKERLIESAFSKHNLGLGKESSLVVTKEMLGKDKLEEFKQELANIADK
jgi:DNA-binding PadR family transcriptional regulator